MRIQVSVGAHGHGKYLNVFLDVPSDDFGNTGGLCGTFDNIHHNDLQSPNGHNFHHTRPGISQFANSWT